MNARFDILLVGQTPPPHHGQAVVTAMLFDHDWRDLKVQCLRMAYSESIESVGKFSIGKLIHLAYLISKTWWIALSKRPEVFYYLPASANKAPVIRDIIYLTAVRWCFSKTVFHYHAAGLPKYLDSIGLLGKAAKRIYAHADLSIDVIETAPPTGSFFKSDVNTVVKNGIDIMRRPRIRQSNGVFQILFVGLLSEGKGITQMVETAKKLRERDFDFQFKVVGDWSCDVFRAQVKDEIENEHLSRYFQFTGPLSGKEKWQAYADADCFFFPSHYESETFGLVLVEAMAFSLPLVTTRWRGIPKVVEGGDCAILCDIQAPEQFANAINDLAKDEGIRTKMGEASRRHYSSRYTKNRFISNMENVFSAVLGK
jgi:glycosyltransferase involved in cell wall biosynthesis